MLKKAIALLLIVILVMSMAACSRPASTAPAKAPEAESTAGESAEPEVVTLPSPTAQIVTLPPNDIVTPESTPVPPANPDTGAFTTTLPLVSGGEAIPVTFDAGAASAIVQGLAQAVSSVDYVVSAQAGQQLTANLAYSTGSPILVIWGEDGTVLISDHAGAATWQGALPITQKYFIKVRNDDAAPAEYTLEVGLSAPQSAPPATLGFETGNDTSSVYGAIGVGNTDHYAVPGLANQTLQVFLTVHSGAAVFSIVGADGTILVSNAKSWEGPLPLDQEYTIDVTNTGGAKAKYTMTVILR